MGGGNGWCGCMRSKGRTKWSIVLSLDLWIRAMQLLTNINNE